MLSWGLAATTGTAILCPAWTVMLTSSIGMFEMEGCLVPFFLISHKTKIEATRPFRVYTNS